MGSGAAVSTHLLLLLPGVGLPLCEAPAHPIPASEVPGAPGTVSLHFKVLRETAFISLPCDQLLALLPNFPDTYGAGSE